MYWVTVTGYFGRNYVCSRLHTICTRRAYISHTLGFIARYVDAAFIVGVMSIKILKDVQVAVTINLAIKFKRGKASITSILHLTLRILAMAGKLTHTDQVTKRETEQVSCLVACDTV